MSDKNPCWTRSRAGRNRVHWVAYDDRPDAEGRRIVDQGDATSLAEADAAARSALAAEGMYQARRVSPGSSLAGRAKPRPAAGPTRREYLYTRHHEDHDDGPCVAAHLVVKKTPKKLYVTQRSHGPDQLQTDDEVWEPNDRTIPLDRTQLDREGSAHSRNYRHSDFYPTRDAALGETSRPNRDAFAILGLSPPCTIEDLRTAYRRKAFNVHPDRGGSPGDFQAVEAAYRRLLTEALGPDA